MAVAHRRCAPVGQGALPASAARIVLARSPSGWLTQKRAAPTVSGARPARRALQRGTIGAGLSGASGIC
jgi:hypothetical protein